jgi:uncharacterized protein YndB with AHSA1/START domain
MTDLPYELERTVLIRAPRERVFQFFTDSPRWASWWGPGSTIDARPGGKVYIRHSNGVESLGEVLEVHPPDRIVFTYGFASGKPIPPGSSRVTVLLDAEAAGTRVLLRHEFAEAAPRDAHVQGWRFQLSLFSNAVTNEVFADASGVVDAWFRAWQIAGDASRESALADVVTPGITFRDSFSAIDGLPDLSAHTGAAQRFMPNVTLARKGQIRHSQGHVLADWIASDRDGRELRSGTSLFVFTPDVKIECVVGFANPRSA